MQHRMWHPMLLFLVSLMLMFCGLTRANTPIRVGIGVSDQIYQNPIAQSVYEQLLINELLQALTVSYEIIRAPHARLRQMLNHGELDLAVRQQQPALSGIYLTAPYTHVHNKVFAMSNFRGQLQSMPTIG